MQEYSTALSLNNVQAYQPTCPCLGEHVFSHKRKHQERPRRIRGTRRREHPATDKFVEEPATPAAHRNCSSLSLSQPPGMPVAPRHGNVQDDLLCEAIRPRSSPGTIHGRPELRRGPSYGENRRRCCRRRRYRCCSQPHPERTTRRGHYQPPRRRCGLVLLTAVLAASKSGGKG